MPRPRRAQGRPGTRVIPKDWSQSHAPVADKTMTGKCQLFPPGDGPLLFDRTKHASTRGPVVPSYDDVCRVQVLKTQGSDSVVGEQTQNTVGYLITIRLEGAGADDVTLAHTVHITEAGDDPALVGQRLRISSIAYGTLRFERDLFCVEDQSAPAR